MRLLSRFLIALVICVVAVALPAAPTRADGTEPSIILSPSSGVPGDEVTVYGYNFTHNEYVDIYYDGSRPDLYVNGAYTDSAQADVHGNFEVDFKVPPSCKGTHTVLAQEESNTTRKAERPFTVRPGLTVAPEEGPVGTNVTVTGQGFAKDEGSIELRYYLGSNYTRVGQNIEADEYGSWEKSFLAPSSAQGAHRIDAQGETSAASAVRDTTFQVTPAISLAQPSGSPGQNITMAGNGFYASDSYIKILFEGEETQTGIIRADDNGYWEGDFQVPAMPIGTYSVTARGRWTSEEDITPLSFEIRPGLVLSPSAGHVGTNLAVMGYGLPVNETVSVMYDGNQMATAETGDQGSFETSFIVPESRHGAHQVTARDAAGNNATAIFTMESVPPGTPELNSPANGSRLGFIGWVRPTFNWSAVTDVSGVYYSLQIATSANVTAGGFVNPVVSITRIPTSNYTLNSTQALPYGTYYWIVQAVDRAGNAGTWTTAYSFRAGVLPLWAFILIIVAIVAAIGTAVYFFVIRKRIYYY
jgi:hypothetical protein